jgi:hypothetical protein
MATCDRASSIVFRWAADGINEGPPPPLRAEDFTAFFEDLLGIEARGGLRTSGCGVSGSWTKERALFALASYGRQADAVAEGAEGARRFLARHPELRRPAELRRFIASCDDFCYRGYGSGENAMRLLRAVFAAATDIALRSSWRSDGPPLHVAWQRPAGVA